MLISFEHLDNDLLAKLYANGASLLSFTASGYGPPLLSNYINKYPIIFKCIDLLKAEIIENQIDIANDYVYLSNGKLK